MLSERRQTKKECTLDASIYIILGNANAFIVTADLWLPGIRGAGAQERDYMRQKETFGDDGYIILNIHMSKLVQLYA